MRGKTVAILESRLGPQMVDLVAKHGGVPMHAPALAEVPDVDPEFVAPGEFTTHATSDWDYWGRVIRFGLPGGHGG